MEPPRPSLGKKVGSVLLFLIGVPGILAAILTLLPRVTVTVSDPVDPDNPFSASATVTNTGYIPLESVMPYVGLGGIRTTGGPPEEKGFKPIYIPKFRRKDWPVRDLGLDDKFTFSLNEIWSAQSLESADVGVWVDYEVPVLHWKREKLFPIVARKQTNGKLYWYAKTKE